ncbi:MAG: AraC family transcriptional regulator [Pseudomonadales bacterium]|nr:AraC family transcriptional regulator [Pseudomonadales bacterium]
MTNAINKMTNHLSNASTADISHTATAPAIFVLQLFQGAIAKSFDLGEIASVVKELEAEPSLRVSLDTYIEYFKNIRAQLNDELLGFFPQPVPIGVYRALCHGLIYMPSVKACIKHMNYTYRLFNNNQDPFQFEIIGDSVRFIVNENPLPTEAQPFFQQSMLLTPIKTLGWLTGTPITLNGVSLTHESYGYGGDLALVYGCSIEFDQAICFAEFSKHVLERPVIRRDAEFVDYVRHSFVHIIKQDYGNRFINQVKQEILPLMKSGFPSLEQLGKRLGMAPATLSRRLQENDTQYNTIKDELRRDAAIYYLTKTEHSTETIARELGYSEYSPFHRAFKKWLGVTPNYYRKNYSR